RRTPRLDVKYRRIVFAPSGEACGNHVACEIAGHTLESRRVPAGQFDRWLIRLVELREGTLERALQNVDGEALGQVDQGVDVEPRLRRLDPHQPCMRDQGGTIHPIPARRMADG